MKRQNLAKKLVAANNQSARADLLKRHESLADEKLALYLKENCLEAYSTNPSATQKASASIKALLKFRRTNEIKAYSSWISGIAEITRGKLESAVTNLDKAAAIFRELDQAQNSAQSNVAKLIPLALMGKYDEAIRVGKSALKVLEESGDQLTAGKVEMNLSNILARRQLHRESEKYCLSARKRFAAIDEKNWLTMAENGLANTYAEINDFRKAEKFYTSALEFARTAGMHVTEAEIEASIGNLATFRGNFDRALHYLETSRQKFEKLEMPHQTAIAELEIADIYLELNLGQEAFSIYERITEDLKKLKMQGEEARARGSFGKSAVLLKNEKLAKAELAKSARLYVAEKNKVGAAAVKLTQANFELDSGRFRTALNLVDEAERLLKKSDNIRHKLTTDLLKGEALRNLDQTKKAEKILKQVLTEALKQEQRNIAQTALNSLGNLAIQNGETKHAEKYFLEAIELVENLRAPLPAEEFKMAFLADKLAPFENLAKIYIADKRYESAFDLIERGRSRSLTENLDERINSKQEPRVEKTSHLTTELNDLREELNWFYNRLNRAKTAELEELQAEVRSRETKIADLMRRIESVKHQGAKTCKQISNKDISSVKPLQKLLGKRKVLVEFVKFGVEISAFLIGDDRIDFVANLAKETEILELMEGLHFQFGALRYGAKNLDRFMPQLKKRSDFYLQELYKKLLKPLEGLFEDRDLVIVPVGALHYVPFHALRNDGEYLIESREIVYSPSARVWHALNQKQSASLKNALLIGFADEKIPLVDKEIKTIGGILKNAKSLVGENASFANYTKEAEKFDVLHLACHGQFRPDNPMFSSLHLADGSVTVRDICAQQLNAGLVTLSACETGLSKIFAGDEILGLARGFLSAGASSLVLSLWTVNDEATGRLMKDFYKNLQKGETVSSALKTAQCNFIKQNSHPYYWSPFVMIGK